MTAGTEWTWALTDHGAVVPRRAASGLKLCRASLATELHHASPVVGLACTSFGLWSHHSGFGARLG